MTLDDPDVSVRRYVVLALLAVAGLLLITLLVRPLIFSLAGPRDDANFPVLSVAEADKGPILQELRLNDPHDLPGEVVQGDEVGYTVVIAPLPGRDGYSVVGAWSPINGCALAIAGDRLRDCRGATWTFEGFPFREGNPRLTAFPVTVRNGAVLADFTKPMDPGTS
ncbi:MAG TPA: hypothetical protein VIA82_06310 [Candidatus Limnocylindria bacterium]|jgi:hypothetical protein